MEADGGLVHVDEKRYFAIEVVSAAPCPLQEAGGLG